MKIKVETVAFEKASGQPTSIEVLLDIDERNLARVLGARAFKSSRKMTQAHEGHDPGKHPGAAQAGRVGRLITL